MNLSIGERASKKIDPSVDIFSSIVVFFPGRVLSRFFASRFLFEIVDDRSLVRSSRSEGQTDRHPERRTVRRTVRVSCCASTVSSG